MKQAKQKSCSVYQQLIARKC